MPAKLLAESVVMKFQKVMYPRSVGTFFLWACVGVFENNVEIGAGVIDKNAEFLWTIMVLEPIASYVQLS